MASVKVAVRVRPFNQRELDLEAKLIIQMQGNRTGILNCKANARDESIRYKEFTFDYSYWSHNKESPNFVSQEQVYNDLGTEVVDCAFQGYNGCVFAYGQTGSGKTFTMMGSPEEQGLIPRVCKSIFDRMVENSMKGTTHRVSVSYLEIYQEKVADLLKGHNSAVRVREHPKKGPYVEGLTTLIVTNYEQILECITRGNANRTTAATNMNDVSSRSHAIFTITFVQAGYCNGIPSETVSKIHLVDLAGSERADATGSTGKRLKEGAHINKSLVTLGSVISSLAELCSEPSGYRRSFFIPYRDSVLTWLLKDSLGGNSKTIMIATISPADCNYAESLSTLRYANRAKNIINKPTINEDPNVKLIRELREEISKLRALMFNEHRSDMLAKIHEKEAREKELTEEWTSKWREAQAILREQTALGLRKAGPGVVLDSDRPHLVAIDDDPLSTGVTLYHLKEGETTIGTEESHLKQDIVLRGPGMEAQHCSIIFENGIATLHPKPGASVCLNSVLIDLPTRLTQGCIIFLGKAHVFRFNDPAEAAELRKSEKTLNLSRLSLLSWSTPDLSTTHENLSFSKEKEQSENIREDSKKNEEVLEVVIAEDSKENMEVEDSSQNTQHEDALDKAIQNEKLVNMFSHYNETEVSDNKLISLIKDRLRFSEGDNSEVFEQLKQLLTQQKFEETEQSKQFLGYSFNKDNPSVNKITSCSTSCLASICASSSHQELDHLSCSPKSQTEGELSSDDDTKHFHDFPHPSASRSMLRDINENNCDNIISITNYILRGAGNQTHYEYEVKINTTDDKWTVYRRYSRFRELYLVMKSKYGQKVSNIPFPPRQLFRNTEAVAKNRKRQLETYLRLLIQSLGEPITREALINISPFFKKGIFENGKYSTS